MPGYSNPGSDLYSDGPEAAPAAAEGAADEQGDEQTATLPKSILMGKEFNVGDEVVLEIKAIHDDEIEVAYAKEKGKEEESESGGGGDSAGAPGGGSDDLQSMMAD